MDYPHRARLKACAHVETLALDDDLDLATLVTVQQYKGKLERVFRLRLETFDWNCQQHIIPRSTEQEIVEAIRPLRDRLAQLESENAELRSRLADTGAPNEHSARPVPPVTPETAIEKVRLTEDGMEQS
jgi:uncharacterized protein